MAIKKQSKRLSTQHKLTKGVIGIFGEEAKSHDSLVGVTSKNVMALLERKYPRLVFRHRSSITKEEIHEKLQALDKSLGQTLFLKTSSIKPDGGIVEVKDDKGKWRVILVSEAKHQGKDIENISKGILVGKNKDQDLMAAGNAIERSHKNICEIANFLLGETYFPYVLFIEGSNFLTQNVSVTRPDGRIVTLRYDDGVLNRIDRLTAANYGLPLNTNLTVNKHVQLNDKLVMLQAASIYTQGDGNSWSANDMQSVMLEVAESSIRELSKDLFNQLFGK